MALSLTSWMHRLDILNLKKFQLNVLLICLLLSADSHWEHILHCCQWIAHPDKVWTRQTSTSIAKPDFFVAFFKEAGLTPNSHVVNEVLQSE